GGGTPRAPAFRSVPVSSAALLLAFPLLEGDGLVGKHDRDVVLDPVDELRLPAHEELAVGRELESALAHRADENVQQLLTDRHGRLLSDRTARVQPWLVRQRTSAAINDQGVRAADWSPVASMEATF